MGKQKSFFTDVGFCFYRHQYDKVHGGGYSAWGYYTSLEWVPAPKPGDVITGIKVGAECINSTSTGGVIEIKYQKNTIHEDIVITPKLCISLSGIVGVYYGYNFSTKGNPFFNIGHHQFSLVCNIVRKPFR